MLSRSDSQPPHSSPPEVATGSRPTADEVTQGRSAGRLVSLHLLAITGDFDDQYGWRYTATYSIDGETLRQTTFARQRRHDEFAVVGGEDIAESDWRFGELVDLIISEAEDRSQKELHEANLRRASEWLAFREGGEGGGRCDASAHRRDRDQVSARCRRRVASRAVDAPGRRVMPNLRDQNGRPDSHMLSAVRLGMLEGAVSSVLDGTVPEANVREHLQKYLDRVCLNDEEFIADVERRSLQGRAA